MRRFPRRPPLAVPLLLAGAALLAASPARAQRLSAPEQRIVESVRRRTDEAVTLLQRLTEINSGTMNHAGVRAVGAVLAAELESLGFDADWIEMPDSVNRAGHLFARREGTRGKKVLLIGHLDTVFEEDSPFQGFSREGSTARGPGVGDMKGGDVVILFALKALHDAGALDGTTITAAFTGDEESPGEPLGVARRDLIEAAIQSDVALGFEGGVRDASGEYGTVARRSASSWILRVTGKQSHSSGIFGESAGSGAIFEAARILAAFHEELRGEQYLTFNPGVILGGTEVEYDSEHVRGSASGKTNIVARSAVVEGDIRTISDEQLDRTRERMRAIVARHLPGTDAEIVFADGYPAMAPTEGNRKLLDRLNAVNRDLGLAPMRALDPGLRGAADISFVAPFVDGLAGLGVYGSGSHSPEETMDLESLPRVIERAALLIYRLTHEAPGA